MKRNRDCRNNKAKIGAVVAFFILTTSILTPCMTLISQAEETDLSHKGYEMLENGDRQYVSSVDDSVTVIVTGPENSFPAGEDVALSVQELSRELSKDEKDDAETVEGLEEAMEVGNLEAESFRIFDINFLQDDKKIELEGDVIVQFTGLEDIDTVLYFDTEKNSLEELDFADSNDVIAFSMNHFSTLIFTKNSEEEQVKSDEESSSNNLPEDSDKEGMNELESDANEIAKDLDEAEQVKKSFGVKQLKRNAATSLKVSKTWTDYWAEHAPITVDLLSKDASGRFTPTGKTVVLSDANNWEASFTGLDVPEEGEEFKYMVREREPENYIPQYGSIKKISHGNEYWVPVPGNTISNGGEYVFWTENSVMDCSGSTYITPNSSVTKVNQSVTVNGSTYSNYLTGVPSTAVFTASSASSGSITGFKLRNGNNYIRYAGFTTVASRASIWMLRNQKLCSYEDNNPSEDLGRLQKQSTRFNYDDDYTGSTFTVYMKVGDASQAGDSYEINITNTPFYQQQESIISRANVSKTIDYLGDSTNNTDTSLDDVTTAVSLEDFYRLYLSVESTFQAIDLLFVVDMTQSMDTNSDMQGRKRSVVLDEVMNGKIIGTGSGATANRDDDGIIYNFLNMHKDNKIAVLGFTGGNGYQGQTYQQVKPHNLFYTQPWTTKSGMKNGGATPKDCYTQVARESNYPPGTCYETGLMGAGEVLEEVANDGNLKVLVFLTDGEPNNIYENGKMSRAGNNSEVILAQTRKFFVDWCNQRPGLMTYIVGVSSGANSGNCYTTLKIISDAIHGIYYTADTKEDLLNGLEDIVNRSKLSLVEITDNLSQYVEYYADNPDLKLEMTDMDGTNKVTLWENGRGTSHNMTGEGLEIISDIVYTPSDSDTSTGDIKVMYNRACRLDGTHKFILSYNAKLTDQARIDYFNNDGAYGVGNNYLGEPDTDYPGNITSSDNPGFRSNKNADISYTTFGTGFKKEFPHPVVQVPTKDIKIKKTDYEGKNLLGGVHFQLYRKAEANVSGAVRVSDSTSDYGIPAKNEMITSKEGTAQISAPYGTYFLCEKQTANGYTMLRKPIAFEIDSKGLRLISGDGYCDSSLVSILNASGVQQIHIKNEKIYELPSAGGMGLYIYCFLGSALVSTAIFSVARRKTAIS